jgi:hypothetical protein
VGLTQRPAQQPDPTIVLDDAIDTTAAADLDVCTEGIPAGEGGPWSILGLSDAPAGRSACWAVQTSHHAGQQSKTDQQISFRNR